jgi:hypothetical protein
MKLNYKFAKHVIMTFQNSRAGYVKPFLEPVVTEADGASDYYTVIKHPMDLSTMLQELKEGKYGELYDVKRSFNRMFSNCFKYNSSSNDVYRKGLDFRKALYEVWYGIDDWIEAQATESRHLSDEDVADGSSEAALHDTSGESRITDISRSDKNTQEDNESLEDDLPPVRRRRYVSYRESSPDEDTSDEDQMEDTSESEGDTPEDYPPTDTRQKDVLNRLDLTDDDTPTKPEQKNRARKKDGSKRHFANVNNASSLNANHKRPLDTTADIDPKSLNSRDQAVLTEQPTGTDNFPSVQQQETSVDKTDTTPNADPLQTYLTEIVTKQLDTTTARINANADGNFTEHLKLLEQLCCSGRRERFYEVWQTKAMEKVSQMQVQDILIRGVEREAGLALAETVTEQAREFCEQVTSRATAFSRSFGGQEDR